MENKIFGYARVSTNKQNLERQIKRLIEYGIPMSQIFFEKKTGTNFEGLEYKKLSSVVRSGDEIVITDITRLARNAEKGYSEYMYFYEKNINLKFLNNSAIDTKVLRNSKICLLNSKMDSEILNVTEKYVNKIISIILKEQIKNEFLSAEEELNRIHMRIKEGQELAKEKGKQIGRQPKLTTAQINEIEKLLEIEHPVTKIAKKYNVSRPVIYNIKNRK